jgi:hypothetical protein
MLIKNTGGGILRENYGGNAQWAGGIRQAERLAGLIRSMQLGSRGVFVNGNH